MTSAEFEKKLISLNPALECLKFLYYRILRDDYRGTHKLQHYRWSAKYIKLVLKNLREFSDEDGFLYHTTGDIYEDYAYKDNELSFAKFLRNLNFDLQGANEGSVTDMGVRKIIFVNLQRMGFITRYTKDKELCEIGKVYRNYRFVKLTQSGLDFLNATSLFAEQRILGLALDAIFDGLVQDILDLLVYFDEKGRFLSIDEMTFFVSYLGKNYKGEILNKDKIAEFILEFRQLGARQKIVAKIISDFCNPKNFSGTKTDKRDLHNWKNEAQTLFDSLDLMSLFEFDRTSKRLFLRTQVEGEKIIFKRSATIKQEYFNNHGIEKDEIFELHHIVPFYFAKDIDTLKIIDAWQNLIYIDANSHKRLTHKSGRNAIRLNFKGEDVILDDFLDFYLCLKFEQNAKYKPSLQGVMVEYNRKLL